MFSSTSNRHVPTLQPVWPYWTDSFDGISGQTASLQDKINISGQVGGLVYAS